MIQKINIERGEAAMHMATNIDMNEKIKEVFQVACYDDNSSIVKEYLDKDLLNPCENGYHFLKYAIERKCKNIVTEMLNSHFFKGIANDTKYSIQVAASIGDFSFALYMLK